MYSPPVGNTSPWEISRRPIGTRLEAGGSHPPAFMAITLFRLPFIYGHT